MSFGWCEQCWSLVIHIPFNELQIHLLDKHPLLKLATINLSDQEYVGPPIGNLGQHGISVSVPGVKVILNEKQ